MTQPVLDEAYVADAWDHNADRWAADVGAGYDVYREHYTLPAFLDFMPPIAGKRVIDLGCGDGANTRRFARLGGRMTGIDLSARMIELACAAEAAEPLGIRYERLSFSDIAGIEESSFEIALSTMALMDGPDIDRAMAEAFRILVPGGRLCFSILHPTILTPAFEWLIDEDGRHSGIRCGRYFDRNPFVEHWRFSKRPDPDAVEKFTVPRFPRSLSTYVNAVCNAGFRLEALAEPRPDEEAARKFPWLARWYDHAPLILMVSAIKG